MKNPMSADAVERRRGFAVRCAAAGSDVEHLAPDGYSMRREILTAPSPVAQRRIRSIETAADPQIVRPSMRSSPRATCRAGPNPPIASDCSRPCANSKPFEQASLRTARQVRRGEERSRVLHDATRPSPSRGRKRLDQHRAWTSTPHALSDTAKPKPKARGMLVARTGHQLPHDIHGGVALTMRLRIAHDVRRGNYATAGTKALHHASRAAADANARTPKTGR